MRGLDIAEQLDKHLNSPKQTWLFGAGISRNANIPLMVELTELVLNSIEKSPDGDAKEVLSFIKKECSEESHIEHYLTYLGDLISLASHSHLKSTFVKEERVSKSVLKSIYQTVVQEITELIRWGNKKNTSEKDATSKSSALDITEHLNFVKAVFNTSRAGLDLMRSPVEFYTTNYDTLLEDALAFNGIHYQDGFSGGAIAFWDALAFDDNTSVKARLYKLHGSIDWLQLPSNQSTLFRVRYGDEYHTHHAQDAGNVMIYPQATKYLNTQRDPFAQLFQRFRHRLADGMDHVLFICGYSFGDEHINAEIERAMCSRNSQLTIVAFTQYSKTLSKWKLQPWAERIFIVSTEGLSQGRAGPYFKNENSPWDWWTFKGATKLINYGLPDHIREKMQ